MDKKFGKEYFDSKTGECGTPTSLQTFEYLYPRVKRFAIQIKNIFNPTTILDIGCAKGFRCLAFKDIGIDAYGVDVREYAIINAAPKEIRPYLYKVDLNKDNLPFKDNSFDLITFVGTIEYLDTHEHIFHEINRVLPRGGILYMTTIYRRQPEDRYRINVQDEDFWIKEFKSLGFKYMPKFIKNFRIVYFENALFGSSESKASIKLRIGRILYKSKIGSKFLIERYVNRAEGGDHGILIFQSEKDEMDISGVRGLMGGAIEIVKKKE